MSAGCHEAGQQSLSGLNSHAAVKSVTGKASAWQYRACNILDTCAAEG